MNVESIREYCISKPDAEECFPFDEVTLVFKVFGKMFAIVPLDNPSWIGLKCDPERAVELRDEYPDEIVPGNHLNKKHWNSVIFNGRLDYRLVVELIDHSYSLVLPRKARKK